MDYPATTTTAYSLSGSGVPGPSAAAVGMGPPPPPQQLHSLARATVPDPTLISTSRRLFHSIVLFQATSSIQTKQRLDNKTENRYKVKGQKHRKHKNTRSKTIKTQKTYIHIYTTRSDFTKALQLAASDFLDCDYENR